MEITRKEQFGKDFYNTIKREFDTIRRSYVKNGDYSEFHNIPFSKLNNAIAYLYCMSDEQLFAKITECLNGGYGTKLEIASMFHVQTHVLTSRIIAKSNVDTALKIRWNEIIDSISDGYDLIKITDLYIEKEVDGVKKDYGFVSAVRKMASQGFSRKSICTILKFNPASYELYPVLMQAYSEGVHIQNANIPEEYDNAIRDQLINNKYFRDVALPNLKRDAEGHKIQLVHETYRVVKKDVEDEATGEVTTETTEELVGKEITEKYVKPDKDARKMLFQLMGGKFLEDKTFEIDGNSSVKNLTMIPATKFDEHGVYIGEEEIEEAEVIEDDKDAGA